MKRILPLLLCLSLLVLGGCSTPAAETPSEPHFGDHLDLSQLSAAALADTVE